MEWSGTLWGVFHTDLFFGSTAQEFLNMCAAMNEKDLYTAAAALDLYVVTACRVGSGSK